MANCGKCHICGTDVQIVMDGEEWCPNCQRYQRPASHGWAADYGDNTPCVSTDESIADAIAQYILQQKRYGSIHDGVKNPHASAAWEIADRLGVWTQVADKVGLAEALGAES